jgi:hypothetical protein
MGCAVWRRIQTLGEAMINIRYVNLLAMVKRYRSSLSNKLKITLSDGNMAGWFRRFERSLC